MPKLWKSVVQELQVAQEQTKDNDAMTLYFCVNYGGRAEIADAAQAHRARTWRPGKLDPSKVNEKTIAKYLYYPDMPDVDLFLRPSGEQRTSNYLIWQSELRRDGLPGRAVAGLRPARPVAGVPGVRPA